MIIDARLRQPLAWLASLVFVAGCAQDAPEQQPVSDDPLVRTTVEGTVRGQVGNNGALEWLGIPFAEPPTDELRWMPPLPPAERDSIRASFEAPDCAQLGNPFSPDYDGLSVVGSEDCLYLDIYAPAESNGGESLPVMVWIHGGANTWGGP